MSLHVFYVTSNTTLEDKNNSDIPYVKDLISALVKMKHLVYKPQTSSTDGQLL